MTGPGFVVMAVYQPNPHLLERQIASLSGQTEADWKCLIGIDGADEEARRIIERLIEQDDRMRVHEYPENRGVYRHFERLLAEVPAEAQWVALADQDDVWHPTKLARLTQILGAPGVTAAMCQARLVDADGRLLGHTDRKAAGLTDLLLRNQVTGSFAVFRGATARMALPFPMATPDAMHDHWLAVFAAATGEVRLIEEGLQDYVQHATNVLGEERPTSVRETIDTAHASGGFRAHLNRIARDRWGWRVNMARGLDAASLVVTAADRTFVRTVAEGRVSMVFVQGVVSNWWAGRLRGRAVASTLVSAWWFSRHFRGRAVIDESGQ